MKITKTSLFLILLILSFVFTCILILIQKNDVFPIIYNSYGCSIPMLDPFDRSLRAFLPKAKPLVCKSIVFLIYQLDNNTLAFNQSAFRIANVTQSSLRCYYQTIIRYDGDRGVRMNNTIPLELPATLPYDFYQVTCRNSSEAIIYKNLFSNISPTSVHRDNPVEEESPQHLSVILFAIDSASRSSAIRRLPKTMDILRNLQAYDFKGHTKVGENTFPNIIPLLTGLNVSELHLPRRQYMDKIPFLWNNYSKNGYTTFYAEDTPTWDTFNFNKRGFQIPPTDHYMRPYQLALWNVQKMDYPYISNYCYNGMSRHSLQINYLKQFLDLYKRKRRFALSLINVLCHNTEKNLQFGDDDLRDFVQWMDNEGHLKNTVFIIFGDHGNRISGIRRTPIGYLEDRMPLLQMIIPEQLKARHATVHESLLVNTNRLTTHFDLHQTIVDVLKQSFSEPSIAYREGKVRGISLFKTIPLARTCRDACIPDTYCVCDQTIEEPTSHALAKTMSETGVQMLNHIMFSEDRCAKLTFHKTTSVRRYLRTFQETGIIQTAVSLFRNADVLDRYIVQFQTIPGFGIFEATIGVYLDGGIRVEGDIDRVNKYGNQSACIQDGALLRAYCYCVKKHRVN
ncbi:uncharacterized protein LOC128245369 [Mya arenaria]|uniref:uncharacterized protein LOC128245369 n=1 Tax=Mya arenaria TaxID=6604 RepID=UPI0022E6F4EF|nr:uncharacterized protein LOC128245369 [Mya arenaria]